MSEACLITVGLPVYNSERYLTAVIGLTAGPDFSPISYWSSATTHRPTDTAQICQQYAADDSRIQVLAAMKRTSAIRATSIAWPGLPRPATSSGPRLTTSGSRAFSSAH